MSEGLVAQCSGLSELLMKFYKKESGCQGWKTRIVGYDELQSLSNRRVALKELVLDIYAVGGNPRLPITSDTLPSRPYAKEVATFALYRIARALQARNDRAEAYFHIKKAIRHLRRAEVLYNKETQADDLAIEVNELNGYAERKQWELDYVKAEPSRRQKRAKAARLKNTELRNEKFRGELKKAYKNRTFGTIYESESEFAEAIWLPIKAAKEVNKIAKKEKKDMTATWQEMSAKELSYIGEQTVFDQIQIAKILPKK